MKYLYKLINALINSTNSIWKMLIEENPTAENIKTKAVTSNISAISENEL